MQLQNSIITLLLEVDVILLPEPGVGQIARIRLCLAGEECILGYVDSDVFWRGDDIWRPCEKQKHVVYFWVSSFDRAVLRGQQLLFARVRVYTKLTYR